MKPMEVMSAWAEQQTNREASLLNLAIGAVMMKLGEKSIVVTQSDLIELNEKYRIENAQSNDGWTVRLIEK